MDGEWQLQAAKARLSELIQSAQTQGPQRITVRGRPAAVVLSQSEFQKLRYPKPGFVDFIRKSPLAGLELDLTRDKSTSRKIRL